MKVFLVAGRCDQCGRVVRLPRSRIESIALGGGQFASMIGCAVSLIGGSYTIFWGLEALRGDNLIGYLVLVVLGSMIGFVYSLGMWFVFSRVRKLK